MMCWELARYRALAMTQGNTIKQITLKILLRQCENSHTLCENYAPAKVPHYMIGDEWINIQIRLGYVGR